MAWAKCGHTFKSSAQWTTIAWRRNSSCLRTKHCSKTRLLNGWDLPIISSKPLSSQHFHKHVSKKMIPLHLDSTSLCNTLNNQHYSIQTRKTKQNKNNNSNNNDNISNSRSNYHHHNHHYRCRSNGHYSNIERWSTLKTLSKTTQRTSRLCRSLTNEETVISSRQPMPILCLFGFRLVVYRSWHWCLIAILVQKDTSEDSKSSITFLVTVSFFNHIIEIPFLP